MEETPIWIVHYSTYFSSIISLSFHYSTYFSSIFSIYFHYSNWGFFHIFSIFSLFNLLFLCIFQIQKTIAYINYHPQRHRWQRKIHHRSSSSISSNSVNIPPKTRKTTKSQTRRSTLWSDMENIEEK
jgi:hypothetical protein